MKNCFYLRVFIMVSCVVFFTNCEKEEGETMHDVDNEELKLDFDTMKFNLKINFDDYEAIEKDFPENSSLVDKISLLTSEVLQLNSQISYRLEKDLSTKVVEYSVVVSEQGYSIDNFRFIKKLPISINLPNNPINTPYTGKPVEDLLWSCPAGQKLVDTCWTEDCVEAAVRKAAGGIEKGQTVSLTIHHGGALGGVSVCALPIK